MLKIRSKNSRNLVSETALYHSLHDENNIRPRLESFIKEIREKFSRGTANFVFIHTGGTLGGRRTNQGIKPEVKSRELFDQVQIKKPPDSKISFFDLWLKDSSLYDRTEYMFGPGKKWCTI